MPTKNIGFVVDLIGDAQVRSVDGVIRVLSIGDKINDGDILTTGLGAQIVLEFYNGQRFQAGENTEMLLDESVFASLNSYPDDRADQLAELQSLIVEGIDLAELEATAAGAAAGGTDGLHQASVYSRDGNEGIVETRVTPFNNNASDPDNQLILDDVNIFASEDSTSTTTGDPAATTINNDRPVAVDDAITAVEDTPYNSAIELIANDTDLDGDSLSVVAGTFATVRGGSITIATDGSYTYTPALNFNGADSVNYTVTDGSMTDVGTLNITVNAVNDAPVAVDDAITAIEDTLFTSTIDLDLNDTDLDGDALTVVAGTFATAQDGSITIAADGSYSYTPAFNFNGTDTVDYTVTDGSLSDIGTLSINVSAVNNVPDAIDDAGALDGLEDSTTGSLNATMLSNDSDLDGDTLSIIEINGTTLVGGVQSIAVTNGTVNIDAGGNITFSANANYNGPVSFNYTISDGTLTDTATVNGVISAVNDIATVSASANSVTEDDAATLTTSGSVTITDTDAGEAFAVPQVNTAGTYGTFSVDANGNWDYQADNAQTAIQQLGATDSLTETFTVVSQDGTANNTVTVTINGTNDIATVSASSGSVQEDDAPTLTTSGSVIITDTDAGEAFAVPQVNTAGTYGTFSVDANGNWDYQADNTQAAIQQLGATDSLTETFTVVSQDGTASNTVTVTINGTNDIATVSADSGSVQEDDAPTLTTSGSVTITDTDAGEAFALPQINTAGTYGTFSVDANGNWDYQADNTQAAIQQLGATDSLTETFTVVSQDGSANNTVTVTINGTNDIATVSADSGSVQEDDAPTLTTSGSVTITDTDAGEAFAVPQVNTAGTYGTFSVDANGNWDYQADNAQAAIQQLGATDSLTETFTVVSQDGTASNTVTVTINGTNDIATVSADSGSVQEDDAPTLTTSGSVTITDIDAGEAFAVPQVNTAGTYGTFSVDANGNWDYQADNAQTAIQQLGATDSLTETFTVVSQDGSANNTVTVTINGTNDIATVSADSGSVQEDDAPTLTTSGSVTITDTDAGEAFAVPQVNTAGTYGTFSVDANGNWDYQADNTQAAIQQLGATDSLTETFTVVSQDGTASNTVTVTINGTNDIATVSADSGSVQEDDAPTLTTSGSVTITDIDAGEAFAVPQVNTAGTYGTFSVDANGNWDYQADNAQTAIQQLGATDSLTETFTVVSQDGSANNTVTVTINGTNDIATVNASSGSVQEDDAPTLTTSGSVIITDTDAGEAFAVPQVNTAGTYGTFSVDANGNWNYQADNTQAAIQQLGATDSLTETFTVVSQDGTASNTVTVTINGTNDIATVSADSGSVQEDDAPTLTTSGSVTITDTDAGEAFAVPQVNTAGTYGTFSVDANGNWDYQADNAQTAIQQLGATDSLTETFTVVSQDGSANNTVTVTINGTNDIATVSADSGSVQEDDAPTLTTSGSVTITDTDAGEAFALPQINTAGTYGTFSVDANGNWDYQADNTQAAIQQLGATDSLTETFTVVSQDGSANNTVTVTINGTNDIATVSASSGSVTEDDAPTLTTSGSITITDTDAGEAFAVPQVNTAGTYGTFSVDANGNWDYQADNTQAAIQQLGATDSLTETFTVVSQDGTASNTVTVTINGTNDGPVAFDSSNNVAEDSQNVALNLPLPTDLDVSDVLTVSVTGLPDSALGSVTMSNGSPLSLGQTLTIPEFQGLEFDTVLNATGTSNFSYQVSDGTATDNATATITIGGSNDSPIAIDNSYTTDEDNTYSGNVIADDTGTGVDSDPDGDNLSVSAVNGVTSAVGTPIVLSSGATLTMQSDGSFSYDPSTSLAFDSLGVSDSTTDSFAYTISDGNGAFDVATVTLTINGTNDVATVSTGSGSVTEDDALTLTTSGSVIITDTDAGEAFTQPQINTAGTYGTFSVDANGNWDYQADNTQAAIQQLGATDSLTETFTVVSQDGSDSNTVTVTINGTNDIATVSASSGSVQEDDAPTLTTSGSVTITDTDAGEAFAVPQVNTAGTYGTFSVDSNGNWNYQADNTQAAIQQLGATDSLTETFTVVSQDGSDSNTVTVTINGTNDIATVSADSGSVQEDDAPTLTTSGSVTITDTDAGEAFAVPQINTAGTYGTFSVDANGNWNYQADNTQAAIQQLGATDSLTETFTVVSQDGTASNTVTVTINGTNDIATVSASSGSVQEDDAPTLTTSGSVTITDTDAGEAFAIPQINTAGTYGTFSVDANGNWNYQADNTQAAIQQLGATDSLTETFTVVSQDGSANNTVTVTINGTNDIATVSASSGSVQEDDAPTLTTSGSVTITDTDAGEAFAVPQVNTAGTYGTFSVDANGNWNYQADNTQAAIQQLGATDSLTETFTVVSQDGSDSNTVTVTINGTNDIATVSADSGSVQEDDAPTLTTSGSVTITDTDAGEAFAVPQVNTAGTYGTFSVDANGNWDYQADNTQAAIQQLGATDSLTETFTVVSQDGSDSNTVTVTINGTNDIATVSASSGSVQEDDAPTLTTSGSVTITDTDAGEAFAVPQINTAGTYGTFSVDANGNWDYQADNTQAAIQQLGATDSLTETFTVVSQDGSDSNTVTVTINGTNDIATVSASSGSVQEDDAPTLTTSGSVIITDTDAGEAFAVPQVNTAGTYGTFSVDANGNWDYQADNTQAAIQQLGATDSLTETFTVVSQDGTASNTVTVTINGTNDIATVSASSGSVQEDDAPTLTTSGSVTITDTDAGEAFAIPQINTAGTYGTFSVDANGNWDYQADNTQAAIQQLGATDSLTETFTVVSQDGTASNTVTVTINGTNDIATVSADSGSVQEDDAPTLTTSGSVTITDTDAGEAFAVPQVNTAGTYGTFSVDANGNWDYQADNTQAAIQQLGATDSLTETFTVVSPDGSANNTVTVTINGTNDIATVSASSGSVTEDDAPTLTTSGSITITDTDAGEAFAVPQVNTAGTYGTFSVDANGNWDYQADNTQAAIQQLGATDSLTETFTVVSQDGSDSNTVTVTINGTNDIATVSASSGSVQEDDAPTLTTSGSVTITDTDAGEAFAQPQINTAGTYGTFSVDANGNWDYQADNTQAAIQQLGATDSLTETFTVVSQDGSANNTVTVTINGTNDIATVSASSGSVQEDDAPTLTTSGSVTITDTDAGEAFAVPQVNTAGTYGTFSVDANGNWNYQADNTQAAIQQLGATDSLTETFTVVSQDGSDSNTVTVTINGTNDIATVSASSGSVQEDDAPTLTTSGSVIITDTDAGEAFAVPQVNTAGTDGTFSVDANGNWDYQADNAQAAIQQLGATDSLTETFTVVSQDGTANNTVTVTITGTNDIATVSADSGSVQEDDAPTLTTSGSVTITDTDAGEAFAVPQVNTAGTYGTFSVDANGNWDYQADNAQAAIQQLGATDSLTETFTVVSQDGTASNTVTVTINGTNDIATVSADSGSVQEDDAPTLTTSGSVTITDIDAGEAFAQPQINTAGTYGTFSVDANGNWDYQADNTQTAIQQLGATDSLTETFTVVSQDGSANNTVTVTINGTNDIATVSASSGSVQEDDAPTLTTSGSVTITDTDAGEAFAVPQVNTAGTYGTFSVDANGNWDYQADNAQAAIQQLGATDSLTETFTVVSQDGTASNTVTVTINGTNDIATVSADSGSVQEDDAPTLTTSGSVTITDIDAGEAFAQPQINTAGTYGTFSVDANGNWDYQADNTQAEIQQLGATDSLTETFTVVSQDGSANNTVTVTINGTNDIATVSASSGSVQEDDAPTLTTSGSVTITDTDAGEAFAVPQVNTAGTYGTFSVDANGNWDYQADNTQAAIQQLGATDSLTETFTVVSQDGSANNTVTVTINGTNDIATVSASSGSVQEDDAPTLTTSGSVTITDTDAGEAFAVPQVNTAGTYGTFSVDANGNWNYQADNTQAAIQQLGATDSLTETFTVVSQDGSDSNTVTVTINGTNDIATVSASSGSVQEDDAPTLTTSGSVIITDTDAGEAFAVPQVNTAGTYGTFSVDANGNWDYQADNAQTAIQQLGATDSLTETFTVVSQDGSANNTVTVTITGTNDIATVSADSGSVQEDDAPTLTTSGSVTITDTDAGEAFAVPQVNTAGTYGTFSVDANGNWDYQADNAQAAIQQFGATDSLTETFTVVSQDGTASNTVTVTINGTNDIATVSADSGSVQEDDAPTLTTSGSVTITDTDAGEAFAVPQVNTAGTYGTFSVDANGNWDYQADNTQAAIQQLGATDSLTETFTVESQDGTASNTVTVTINGTNDGATVSADSGSVTEDDAPTLTTSGSVTITDTDAGEAFAVPQVNTAGTYGTFSVDANGNWDYQADNTQAAIQQLGATDSLTETFTVTSQDGTASNTVTVTINGTNDIATVSADSGSVQEDDAPTLTTSGSVTITDTDAGEAFAVPQVNTAGTYGTFSVDANGNWDYQADNTQAAIQQLGATDSLTETFTVTSQDGTASNTVTVTINGTNDIATVSADSGSVQEDDAPTLTTSGSVTITDTDAGEAFAVPQVNTAGTYGTFSVDANGNWDYQADNTQAAIQQLGATDSLTETFSVTSQDGTASNTVTVTINGTNDIATVSADSGSVQEDDAPTLTTSGSVTITDTDAGEAFAQPQINTAGTYGTFSVDANGNWDYQADNTQAAIQQLGATDSLTETFTVVSQDGSANNTVTVTINGTNDIATVSASSGSVTEDDAPTLTTSGSVTITDTDAGEAFAVPQVNTAGTYGTFSVDANGNWDYQADNAQTAIQQLGATDSLTETFTVTSQDGTASNTVTVTINGTNDIAIVSASSGSVQEDDAPTLTTSGSVTITDTDAGEAFAQPQINTAGTYGTFSVDANGNWDYQADNAQAAIQQLGATDSLTETFTVVSQDGSDSNTVTVTINGTNDIATVSASSGSVQEDDAPTLTTSGSVTITDTDAGEAFAVPQVNTAGTYGTFSVDANGNWDYQADNTQAAIQQLGATDSLTETFTVTSQDGTASNTVTVTINGTNDIATVSADSGSVQEDDAPTLTTSGSVTITDTDAGEAFAQPQINTAGTYGTFSVDANGNWNYQADNTQAAIQQLGATDSLTETFTVVSQDGTASNTVTVTINGTNDGPVIDLDANDSSSAGNNYAVTFTEGGSAAYIADTDINITDVDGTSLVGATITVNSVESGDLLTVGAMPAGITASAYDPISGTISLSGPASLSDYQDAIRAIQFSNDGSTVNANRSIDVVVNDGSSNSNIATTDVTINTLPTVSVTDVSVQEPAAGTTTLTFTISIDQTLGTDLTFDYETADISALAGADFVGVSSTVGTITAGNTTTTVTVTVNSDANVFEGDETLALNLTGFNQTVNFDAAAHTISGGVQGIGTIGANNGAPVAVDDSYITTVDTPLIVTNALANDTLVDNAVVDVTGYTDLGSGIYSFGGTNGTVVYDANSGEFTFTPNSGHAGAAGFSYTLIDDDGETDTASVSVDVSSVVVNPPVVSNVPDTAYTENDSPVSVLSGINISDVDSTSLSSVVVTVDGYIGSQDVIDYLTAGTSVVASVTASGSTWELTLTGGVDINEYETVLESINYQNSSDNPSTSVRNITIEAFDQSYANLFGADAGTLSITAVNDAPDVFDNNIYTLESSQDNGLGIIPPTDPDTDDSTLVITVTGLPGALGFVTLADGTPVTVNQTLSLAELTSLQFDAGATQGSGTFSYTVDDGQLTTTGSTTISVGATNPDFATVYEGGLNGGTGTGSAQVSGNLFANDSNASNIIDSIDFGASNFTAVAGVITATTALGTLTVYADNGTPGFTVGDYTYTLNSADNSSADIDEVFTYNFTNGTGYSENLTISIIDDAPVANAVVQDVPESEEQVFNIIFTLDDSGSMAWGSVTGDTNPPASEATRMDVAKESLSALGSEFFNQSTQVQVTLITFNSTASFVGTYSDFAAFETALNAVTPGGGTNYVDATDQIQAQLATDLASQLPADDVQNISYFISDGEANSGTSPIGSGYIEFVNDNSIDSYSVGIGSSLPGDLSDLNYIHNIDSLGQGGGTVDEALIVTDVSELESELLSTVPTAFGGNITANGSVSNVLFGADGGYVQSFTTDLGGTDYTFSYDGSTVTVPAALIATVVVNGSIIELGSDDGFAYGTFTFDFSDGTYTLSAPNGLAPSVFNFDYNVIDGDGDVASATAKINIIDDAPDARDDLHSLDPFEVAAGNVVNALGTDGGPQFGSNISPFTSQGGGVDKIVDNAAVSEFSYQGSTISLDLTTTPGTPPTGVSESVFINSQAAIDASQFTITGSAALAFNAEGSNGVGVAGGQTNNLNAGETLTVNFDLAALPYGADNLLLDISDFQSANGDQVTITVYNTVGAAIGNVVQNATNANTETVDLSAYSGVGSIEITETGGGWDAQLQNISYDPAPATPVVDPAGDDNGSNLSWVYGYEMDLDGNDVYQATVTNTDDGSVFVMRSNGFYQYTPDTSGVTVTPEAVATTSAGNLAASDITLTGFDNTGSPANLIYSGNGVTVQGGNSSDRIDFGEMVTIDFTSKGGNPLGVQNIVFNMTSMSAGETATYILYGMDGTTVIGTENSDSDPFTISAADYPQIGKINFIADSSSQVRIQNITYDEITSAPPTPDPILVDYVLTDTDGQSDSAQLALYTIDQTITGTSGIDNIAGGSLNDAIIGDDGNDILSGNAGHDSLSGGAGDDTLSGGVGNDYLSGGDGLDSLSGGTGSDTLDGGAGDDLVDGSSGDDIVLGGDGDDQVYGGSGDDRLEGDAGDDLLTGGAGNDVIFGDAGEDRLIGGSGNDSLIGGDGIDIFALESGDEGTTGVPAVDTIADFTIGVGGDVLDLSDMLQAEDLASLDGFLNFSYDGVSGDTTISIDVDGDSGIFESSQEIVLSGIDLTANGTLSDQQILDNLLNNGNLIVDQ